MQLADEVDHNKICVTLDSSFKAGLYEFTTKAYWDGAHFNNDQQFITDFKPNYYIETQKVPVIPYAPHSELALAFILGLGITCIVWAWATQTRELPSERRRREALENYLEEQAYDLDD